MGVARTPWNSWSGENLSIEPNLIGANLSEANLVQADLSRAERFEADLSKAILEGATLTGADLSTASLTEDELERATGGENTRLPPDLDPRALGSED